MRGGRVTSSLRLLPVAHSRFSFSLLSALTGLGLLRQVQRDNTLAISCKHACIHAFFLHSHSQTHRMRRRQIKKKSDAEKGAGPPGGGEGKQRQKCAVPCVLLNCETEAQLPFHRLKSDPPPPPSLLRPTTTTPPPVLPRSPTPPHPGQNTLSHFLSKPPPRLAEILPLK